MDGRSNRQQAGYHNRRLLSWWHRLLVVVLVVLGCPGVPSRDDVPEPAAL